MAVQEERDEHVVHGRPAVDEDIPILSPSPPTTTQDVPAVQSNEIRIGPITRARAKLLEQQVNLFLNEPDVILNENFILPKSLSYCMIKYIGEECVARSKEPQQEEHQKMIANICAREEREEGAIEEKEIIKNGKFQFQKTGQSGPPTQDSPALQRRTVLPYTGQSCPPTVDSPASGAPEGRHPLWCSARPAGQSGPK
jgi:hypothetical protein